jgi:hypothetical protein
MPPCQTYPSRYPNVNCLRFESVRIDLADILDNADIDGTLDGHITIDYMYYLGSKSALSRAQELLGR